MQALCKRSVARVGACKCACMCRQIVFVFHHFRVRIICRNVFQPCTQRTAVSFVAEKASCFCIARKPTPKRGGKPQFCRVSAIKLDRLLAAGFILLSFSFQLSSAYLSIKHMLFALNRIKISICCHFRFQKIIE